MRTKFLDNQPMVLDKALSHVGRMTERRAVWQDISFHWKEYHFIGTFNEA